MPSKRLTAYLSLGQSQIGCKLGSFWQSKVLGPLKSSFKMLDLKRGINGSWFPHFLSFTIYPTNFAVLYGFF